MKKMKRSAACVAILVCLTAPALGSTWTGSSGLLWSNGDNWDPIGVPDGVDAIINNTGTPTLNSVSNITNLEVSSYSTLNIDPGAGLTASGSGNIAVGGASDEGYVYQTGGAVSFGSDLTLGDGASDFGRWWMTSGGSLAVANDLTVGGSGAAEFELRDTSSLTVGGSIGIGTSGGAGSMTVSGGTLGQLAGGGDPAILADLAVGSGGSFTVEGNTATINVMDYVQTNAGALNLVLDNDGIASINISGNMMLNGALNVSVATGASPAPGVYHILVPEGTQTGAFNSLVLPEGVELRYSNDIYSTTRLYVDVEAPPVYCPVANYWGFDGKVTDKADIFPGHTSQSETDFDGNNSPMYITLDASNKGPFDAGEQVLTTNNNRAYLTDDAFNDTHDTILGASYTAAFWMNPHGNTDGAAWCFANNAGHTQQDVYFINWNPDLSNVYEAPDIGGVRPATLLTQGEWRFITITHDGNNDKIYFYVNGVLDSVFGPDGLASTRSGPTGVSQFQIGNASKTKYSGNIWYARMSTWTEYLTPNQVARLYANGGVPLDFLNGTASPVPEPAGLGLVGLALLAVRRRRS